MAAELAEFLKGWQVDPANAKDAFLEYQKFVESLGGAQTEFIARPGISYSLRGKNRAGRIFALVDVVDDEPENRWLSVCFYADMVSDPRGQGDFVPRGLLGEDALCFNLDSADSDARGYIAERLADAAASAGLKPEA